MAKVYLTAVRVSPQIQTDLAVPRVESVETNDITKMIPLTATGGVNQTVIKVVKERNRKQYTLAENYGEVILMSDFNNALSSPYNTGTKQNLAPGNGATQAAGTTKSLTTYHNSVTTGDATSTAVALPYASGTGVLKSVRVVKNAASVNILVYPSVSDFLDSSSASNAPVTVLPGKFKHFYASATNKWVTCKGPFT